MRQRAELFVDGRYTLQAQQQVDTNIFTLNHLIENPPEVWISNHLPAGARLGYDPWLHTIESAEKLGKACDSANATLVAVESNPIGAVWTERPPEPLGAVTLHDLRYAGESAEAKLRRIHETLANERAEVLVVSDPQAIAWAFNIRGADISHTPVALAYALIARAQPILFIDGRKLTNITRNYLEGLATVREPKELPGELAALASQRAVRLDQATAAQALARLVSDSGGRVSRGADPIALMKAVKNDIEIEGARSAHRRDGAAVVRFLAWLDREAPRGNLSEIDAVVALERFRRDTGLLKDISFPTIAGAGPNGAIVHYRVTEKSNRQLQRGDLFLVDSGAQYEDGTTDITRTIAVGQASEEMRERFTRVLKGHIAIARAVFPDGTTGAQLDSFSRRFLWAAGLDFDHGTGHGVGSYLSVHEGPARISRLGTTPLKRGMILSNEPGYYKAGAFGIRIENLVLVRASEPVAGAEKPLNCFETLTLAPIERRLIHPGLLTPGECDWLDQYHSRVFATLASLVDAETQVWLAAATRPLAAT
jgi:Xaa-Pro aminopeptidase